MAFTFMKGQPLLAKLSWVSTYVVMPGAMAAALIYSPPEFLYRKKQAEAASSSSK